MTWVKTSKENIEKGMPRFVNVVGGKIVESSHQPQGIWAKPYTEQLKYILDNMDDTEFQAWYVNWFDARTIMEIVENWDEETCKDAVEKLG